MPSEPALIYQLPVLFFLINFFNMVVDRIYYLN